MYICSVICWPIKLRVSWICHHHRLYFFLRIIIAVVFQTYWHLVLCQLFLCFEELLDPLQIALWGLEQILKFVEAQAKEIILKKRMYIYMYYFFWVRTSMHVSLQPPPTHTHQFGLVFWKPLSLVRVGIINDDPQTWWIFIHLVIWFESTEHCTISLF